MPAIVVVVLIRFGVPIGHRVAIASAGPAAATAAGMWERVKALVSDSDDSDAELSAAASELTGTVVTVATFTGSFVTRRVQLMWRIQSGDTRGEDVRVATFHLLKHSGGTPTDDWASADFDAANAAFDAFWNTLKPSFPPHLALEQYRYYKAGPDILPPQPPVHVRTHATPVAGTGIGAQTQLPPQVAITVTEKAGSHKNWGRFYLPAPAGWSAGNANQTTTHGRIATSLLTLIADASDTLYEALATAAIPVVVYKPALPERQTKKGGTLAARGASAVTVDDLQVDDLFDVIRSRRYAAALLKVQRAVG